MKPPPPLTSSAAGSPARTLATPARKPSASTAADRASGASSRGSLELFSRGSSSSRTSEASPSEDSTLSFETLPRSGSMRNGKWYARPMSVHLTDEDGSSSWPTPQARDGDARRTLSSADGARRRFDRGKRNLTDAVSMWPTPTAQLATSGAHSPDATSARRERSGAGCSNLKDMILWPTPMAADSERSSGTFARGNPTLAGAVRDTWPTPTAGDAKASGSRNLEGSKAHAGVSLTDAVTAGTSTSSRRARPGSPNGMVLNPQFVEAMQGFPSGWTEGGRRRTGHQTGFGF